MAGGQSSRMGGGLKSLKKFNNKMIFDRIYENINKQVKNIIINANNEETILNKYNLPIVKDKIKGYLGPLAAIHASLDWIHKNTNNINWLVTIPGDTPFIPTNLVSKLYTRALKFNKDIVLAKSNNMIHSVIGIWRIDLLKHLEETILNGDRKIILWAEKHNLGYEEFTQEGYDPFFNINYKEDLITAKKLKKNLLSNNILLIRFFYLAFHPPSIIKDDPVIIEDELEAK